MMWGSEKWWVGVAMRWCGKGWSSRGGHDEDDDDQALSWRKTQATCKFRNARPSVCLSVCQFVGLGSPGSLYVSDRQASQTGAQPAQKGTRTRQQQQRFGWAPSKKPNPIQFQFTLASQLGLRSRVRAHFARGSVRPYGKQRVSKQRKQEESFPNSVLGKNRGPSSVHPNTSSSITQSDEAHRIHAPLHA